MAKTASQIVDRALSLIDEVPTTFATAATTETSIRDQALAILPEVCRDLIKELPWELKRYLSTTAALVPDVLSTGEAQAGYVKQKVAYRLPADYWEFVSMRLSAWAKPVTKYIFIDDANYAKQNNPFTRAGKQNPVVAISSMSTGAGRVECFSLEAADVPGVVVSLFEYVAFSNVPDDVSISWPDELFDEVTKALATELHIIKARLDEAEVKSREVENAIQQHE